MRFNRLAIDFWLSSIALPEETKQFPENLKATSWHVAEGTVWSLHQCCCNASCIFVRATLVHVLAKHQEMYKPLARIG
jgi:hypothetical protein